MTRPEENCFVRSVAWLLNMEPAEIVTSLDHFCGRSDWFVDDGSGERGARWEACLLWSTERGWTATVAKHGRALTIPETALIFYDGHAAAVRNGRTFDTSPGHRGALHAVLRPPVRFHKGLSALRCERMRVDLAARIATHFDPQEMSA